MLDQTFKIIEITNWGLAGILLVFLLPLIVRYPEVSMALLATIHFVFTGIRFPFSWLINYVTAMTGLSLLIYVFENRFQNQSKRCLSEPLLWLVLVFTGWKILTYLAFGASDPFNLGGIDIRRELAYDVIPFLGIMVMANDKRRIHRFVDWLCIGVGLGMVLFCISFIDVSMVAQYPPILWRSLVNVFGFGVVSFAIYATTGAVLGIVWLAGSPPRTFARRAAPVFTTACIFMILLTGNRTVVVCAPVAVAYCVWKKHNRGRNVWLWGALVAFITFVGFLLIPGGTDLFSVIGGRFKLTIADPWASSSRFEVWQYAMGRFLESPLIGVGTGGGGPIMSGWDVLNPFGARAFYYRMAVHNYYLQILVEQGLVGSISIMLILFMVFHAARTGTNNPSMNRTHDLHLIAVSMLIYGLLGGIVGGGAPLYWEMGLVWVAHVWAREGNQ